MRRPPPTRMAGSGSTACPRSRRTTSPPIPRSGNPTFPPRGRQRHRRPEADPGDARPAQGGRSSACRLIDKSTGKSVDGYSAFHVKLPSNPNEGSAAYIAANFGPEGFRMTVPPGPGFFYAQAAGDNLPYTRARLAAADRGKGVGGEGDGEFLTIILSPCHSYRIVDVPAGAETFDVDLELTRGTSRKGRLVDPEGKPVVGAQAYGLESTWVVKTLEDATFEVTALESGKPRSVSFMHKDRRLAGAVALEPGDGPVEVRLAPCGAATGRLVDPDGQPMADAYIMLHPHATTAAIRSRSASASGPRARASPSTRTAGSASRASIPRWAWASTSTPRSQPGRFLVPEKSKEDPFRHLKARPGETVDLGEIRMMPAAERVSLPRGTGILLGVFAPRQAIDRPGGLRAGEGDPEPDRIQSLDRAFSPVSCVGVRCPGRRGWPPPSSATLAMRG